MHWQVYESVSNVPIAMISYACILRLRSALQAHHARVPHNIGGTDSNPIHFFPHNSIWVKPMGHLTSKAPEEFGINTHLIKKLSMERAWCGVKREPGSSFCPEATARLHILLTLTTSHYGDIVGSKRNEHHTPIQPTLPFWPSHLGLL